MFERVSGYKTSTGAFKLTIEEVVREELKAILECSDSPWIVNTIIEHSDKIYELLAELKVPNTDALSDDNAKKSSCEQLESSKTQTKENDERGKSAVYIKHQSHWIARYHLHVGDMVKVLKEAKNYEDGWGDRWYNEMFDSISETLEVISWDKSGGIKLSNDCYYPYFVLEKVYGDAEHSEFHAKGDLTYQERQNDWVDEHKLNMGDMVKVIRAAKSYKDGWDMEWEPWMDSLIGKTSEVKGVDGWDGWCGIVIKSQIGICCVPYFVLEPVKGE